MPPLKTFEFESLDYSDVIIIIKAYDLREANAKLRKLGLDVWAFKLK